MAWRSPARWLLQRMLREGDDSEAVQRKYLLAYCCPVIMASTAFFGWTAVADGLRLSVICFHIGTMVLITFLFLFTLCTRSIPLWLFEDTMVLLTGVIIVGDWSQASVLGASRVWSLVILVMDVLLTIGAGRPTQWICMGATSVWLILSSIEDGWRLGLYHIEGWTDVVDANRDVVDCGDPPCATGPRSAAQAFAPSLVCLFLDYIATRGFAEGLRREERRVLLMVGIAEQVAHCLVKFDLLAARQALDDAGADGLSPQLADSFHRLLHNLSCYQPFLPESCFAEGGSPTPADPDPRSPSVRDGPVLHDEDSPSPGVLMVQGSPQRSVLLSVSHAPSGVSAEHDPGLSISCRSPRMSVMSASQVERRSIVGSDSGEGSSAPSPRSSGSIGHAPCVKRVTMLHSNRRGLLSAMSQGLRVPTLAQWLAQEVAFFSAAVLDRKGVVDLLSADHLHASFGALRRLVAHRMAAVHCAVALQDAASPQEHGDAARLSESSAPPFGLRTTAAVCTGLAVCGDFGSAAAQRFMVIGGVTSLAVVMERIAADWDARVLTDHGVYADAQLNWDFRLRLELIFAKASDHPIGIWELMGDRCRAAMQTSQKEWMYEVGNHMPNPWSAHSTAVHQWCLGEKERALASVSAALCGLQAAEGTPPRPPPPRSVRAALAALQAALTADASVAPPVREVPIAAGIGLGAPLSLEQVTRNSTWTCGVLSDVDGSESGADTIPAQE